MNAAPFYISLTDVSTTGCRQTRTRTVIEYSDAKIDFSSGTQRTEAERYVTG